MGGITEKLTFEICASLIAYEVKEILSTINRQAPTPINGRKSNNEFSI